MDNCVNRKNERNKSRRKTDVLNKLVKIRYFGSIGERLGVKEESISISEEIKIFDLLELLTRKHGKKFDRETFYYLDVKKKIGVLLTVNRTLVNLDAVVSSGDEVEIISLMSGG